ncbi:hypothetical protein GCM10007857_70450 [Bradyrhizobium iriomotense]|uniref:Uncharacterized protein n=1 Tax=Bradyrhizobium iriomotense TaxID=441950 RepID=A0ABQ6B9G0_9BRAD|nr:hypothetical protein GCM10007857_70450 [Bradyrhizobium iriomotense]
MIGGLVGLAQELPFPGQQFAQARCEKIGDTGEDVGEPGLGIDVVDATGRDHRQHDGGAVGAPRWLPAKVQLRLPKAPLNARSAQLLVKQILPLSRKRAKS